MNYLNNNCEMFTDPVEGKVETDEHRGPTSLLKKFARQIRIFY